MSTTSKLPNRRHFMRRSLALAGGLWAGLETVASPLRADEGRLGAPNRKLHILVCFSWSFRNIGDIAITPGLLRLLKEHVPGVQVTLIANSHLEEYQDYLGTRFPDVNVLRTPFRSTKSASKEFRRAFEAADFVMYNSGTTLSYGRWERDWDRTIPLAMPLFMARLAGKPYGIYCQSFEKFAPPSDLLFPKLLSDAEFVFCRDTNSLDYLKSLGVKPPVLEFGPDSTFAFNLRDEEYADRFLREHRLQPRKFITVTIRSSVQGFIDAEREQAHAAKLREFVTNYVRKTQESVLICPEVIHEIEPSRRLIFEPLPDDVKPNVRLKDSFWLPEEAFSVYARARTIVSMEMHSVIMALAAGTPVLHPAFDEAGRKRHMLNDLGLGQWLFDIDQVPAKPMTDAVLKIQRDFPAALDSVEAAMTIVRKRQKETMEVLKQTLTSR